MSCRRYAHLRCTILTTAVLLFIGLQYYTLWLTQLQHMTVNRQNSLPAREIRNTAQTNRQQTLHSHIGKEMMNFKVYVYQLPSKFNNDLIQCVANKSESACYATSNGGLGPELYHDVNVSVCDTWQFSLEVILHNRMLISTHRTRNASEASIFYIPYYGAVASFCHRRKPGDPAGIPKAIVNLQRQLFAYLRTQKPYINQKPHLAAIGRIERESSLKTFPHGRRADGVPWLILVGIEQESVASSRRVIHPGGEPLIVAPYPSYGHLMSASRTTPQLQHRHIFLFLAASRRQCNHIRTRLMSEFRVAEPKRGADGRLDYYWLKTEECSNQQQNITISIMESAVFCIQPPGDSPTRKSFYDSLVAGCIPVVFTTSLHVRYPFERFINYTQFTVTIAESSLYKNSLLELMEPYRTGNLAASVPAMQAALHTAMPLLQYSYNKANHEYSDAFHMILKEAKYRFYKQQI